MNAFPTSVTRIGALALGILLIGTVAAEAAQNQGPTGERAECVREVKNAYNIQITLGCGSQEYLDQYGPIHGQAGCIADAAQFLHDQLEMCGEKPERQVLNAGVRGVPPSLTESGSGDGGAGGGGTGGGGTGGTGGILGGTFNPSMGSASMSTGGGGGIIQ